MPEPPHVPDLLQSLPAHLAERTRPLGAAEPAEGAFVLYWMRSACRGHENPALDVAIEVARALRLPAFVYQAISERHPYASDRHHTFMLEGARDVQVELTACGIGHALHLERPGQRGPHLRTLAGQASLIVTEEMPVEPLRGWTKRLAASSPAPVWCVDTACVVPMRLTPAAPERAFKFRRETQALRDQRVAQPWPEVTPAGPAFVPADLPFEPLDLAAHAIPELVARCEIDHGVAPVSHTPGGSRAGYARWRSFRDGRLESYARKRNDALSWDAVSRMSAYLHHGQVSPFRLAREAYAIGGTGAAKFLDELLVWRELAHAWCFHRAGQEKIDVLPQWARQTLEEHRNDLRAADLSWETLARGRTGVPLWDAAQRSLLIHGELHNNLRMTWGKALAGWTSSPERALEVLIDLNHRFALDGRDPNSYGGLLWCLGLFDRPFPPRPVTGTIRERPTVAHARRLDVARYTALAGRPAREDPPRIAVIGAGVAGLSCARTLADHGFDVRVFDKGRAPGGRLATRNVEGYSFDHGAQYFTALDAVFRRHIDSWQQDDLVASWPDAERVVAVPGMSALARHLARDLVVECGVRVASVEHDRRGWCLTGHDGDAIGSWDVVAVSAPAPQAVPLLAVVPDLAHTAAAARIEPCWAVLAGFKEPIEAGFASHRPQSGPLGWLARNDQKPGRSGGEAWVLHARPAWSADHLEERAEDVAAGLLDAFAALLGRALPKPTYLAGHRWRYALASEPIGLPCLFDPDRGIGACGDWCLGGRVEAAFLSGRALAGRILGTRRT